jgi:hypothetical protein
MPDLKEFWTDIYVSVVFGSSLASSSEFHVRETWQMLTWLRSTRAPSRRSCVDAKRRSSTSTLPRPERGSRRVRVRPDSIVDHLGDAIHALDRGVSLAI